MSMVQAKFCVNFFSDGKIVRSATKYFGYGGKFDKRIDHETLPHLGDRVEFYSEKHAQGDWVNPVVRKRTQLFNLQDPPTPIWLIELQTDSEALIDYLYTHGWKPS